MMFGSGNAALFLPDDDDDDALSLFYIRAARIFVPQSHATPRIPFDSTVT